jgi:MFS family permease
MNTILPQRWRELTALLSANSLSMIGNYLSAIAIPIFVLELTGSATFAASIVMAGQLPNLLAGFFSGHFIDRFSAKSVSLFSDAVNFFAIALIPLLFTVDMLQLGLLAGLVFFSQVMDSPGSTARRVLVPELIDKHKLPRERTNGLDSLIETSADIAGPILATGLLALTGAVYLLWIDAATFLFSFLIIYFGVQARIKPATEESVSSVPMWESWRWMFQQKQIMKLGVYDLLINTVATPLLSLTLPVLAKTMGEEYVWLGIWLAAFAVGTTFTTALYTFLGHRASTLQLIRLTPLGQIAGLVLVALTFVFHWPLFMVAIGMCFFGMNLGVGSMVDAMLLQKQVPESKRGTVFAAFSSFRFAGMPLGLLIAGVLLDANAVTGLFALFVGLLVVASSLWWSVKQLD